ncbi:Protein kinase domain-containing protein [Pedobacter steynii]|uniref:Protein kinase domain-containing protein n=1 Tax=Pedobacter steynii TaxID=430522 RepID=A0A1G9LFZ5_9SPHI|nr:hypothetical protein [Pedobacter steynii]NQX38837.1 hypothetical protein [Pedobacter steynii]SDL60860.1 Protein kinase domain-containing protein [Pedobacter steynii]
MYPDNLQYKHSIRNSFFDPAEVGTVFTPVLHEDEPVFESGNKAIVFKVSDNSTGQYKALKLFAMEEADRFSRFERISSYLKGFNSPYFVNFEFFSNLIYVQDKSYQGGAYYPGVVMDWAKGVTLGTCLRKLCIDRNKKAIATLAESFKQLALFLLEKGIGHGDLKHDNIIVSDEGKLILVDYDCLYTPAFAGTDSVELGTDAFQHPLRSAKDFNERIDDFSILTIYTSILALSKHPGLYEQFNDQHNLIFTKHDFSYPDDSLLFVELAKDSHLCPYGYLIKRSCRSSFIYIDELEGILRGNIPKPTILISQYPVKPLAGESVTVRWMTQYADYLTLEGSTYPLSGEVKQAFLEGAVVNFIFGNELIEKNRQYKVKLHARAEVLHFFVDSDIIPVSESVKISWKVKGAKKITLIFDGLAELVGEEGTKVVSPNSDCICKLLVVELDCKTQIEEVLNIQVKRNVNINFFLSKDSFIIESIKTKLRWDVDYADEISIESSLGESFNHLSGKSLEVEPQRSVTYTLTAKNALFSAISKCDIYVDPRPRLNLVLPNIVPDKTSLVPGFPIDQLFTDNREQSRLFFEEVFGVRRKRSSKSFFKKILQWKD